MADVTDSGPTAGEGRSTSDGDDRAQLVLVGGVVVAFALVALVLLLNTALFTENVATRGLGPGPDDAEAHAAFAERSTDRVVRHEERIEYEHWSNAWENASRNVFLVDTTVRAQQLQQHGATAAVELERVRRGAVLIQNGSRVFEDDGNTPDWTLAETDGIRNFTMTVDTDPTDTKLESGNFTVVVIGDGGSGGQWTAFVYENNSNVEVHTNGVTCRSTQSTATINWTAGNLAGCSVPFAVDGSSGDALEPPYVLRFENGTNATGTYHVAVRNESNGVRTGNFGAPGSGVNPRQYPAVYSINLTAIYEDSTVEYDTAVRVAPGESNRTRPQS